ncbi:hypothetical protein KI387_029290, partial [Taxus chinensis]
MMNDAWPIWCWLPYAFYGAYLNVALNKIEDGLDIEGTTKVDDKIETLRLTVKVKCSEAEVDEESDTDNDSHADPEPCMFRYKMNMDQL